MIRCLQIVSPHVPIYLLQFPSYSNCKCKKSPFSRTPANIFVSPGDAPVIITQYVASMERQFNSFRLIRCLSPKIAILPHFCLPWGRRCGNHAKRCMNEKTIQCLPNPSQHLPIYLQQFPSYSNCKCKISPFSRTAAHVFVSP